MERRAAQRRASLSAMSVARIAKAEVDGVLIEALRAERSQLQVKGGWPRIDDATHARILADLAVGMTQVAAARRAGVSQSTVHNISKQGPRIETIESLRADIKRLKSMRRGGPLRTCDATRERIKTYLKKGLSHREVAILAGVSKSTVDKQALRQVANAAS